MRAKEKNKSGRVCINQGESVAGTTVFNQDVLRNKILLYSTGNCIQCPTINHYGKECISMYNWITLLYSTN